VRIVLDTNVLVSSLWGGPPKEILKACESGRIKLLLSREILDEYISVLSRFEIEDEDIDLLEALFAHPKRTEVVSPTFRVRIIVDDPADNMFLECVATGQADFIVSSDKHLVRLKMFQGIPILTPRRFLDRLSSSKT
jgi:uncharacterized protein